MARRVGQTGVSVKTRRKDAATIMAGSEVAAVQDGKTLRIE